MRIYQVVLATTLVTHVSSSPIIFRDDDQPTVTTVTLPCGDVTIKGVSGEIVDNFYGVPFAAPPIGDLRFRPPEDLEWNATTWNASRQAPACIQPANAMYTGQNGMSEDCLYLNIQVPKGIDVKTANLPILFWIYGGSWVSGASTFYDGTFLVNQSIQSEKPVIFISTNYRLGSFGFLGGPDAAEEGSANLGIQDVMKALGWVKDNIKAFGGDPQKVTVFGESAGAMIISYLYLQPEMNLFRSAIMQSGAPSSMPAVETKDLWPEAYEALYEYAGCADVEGDATRIDCLRTLPAEDLLIAQEKVRNMTDFQGVFVFSPTIDGDIIPDSPAKLLSEGKFANLSYITGTMKDEGTYFIPPESLPDNKTLIPLVLARSYPAPVPAGTLQELFTKIYPDDPALGSPFGTGNETFGLPSSYKQLSAVFGDAIFQAPRRMFLRESVSHNHTQSWSYSLETVLPTFPPQYGSFHSADIPYTFGLPQIAHLNMTGERAEYAASFNFTEADAEVSRILMSYWINFANDADPNGCELPGWSTYMERANIIQMDVDKVEVIPDTFREEQINYFIDRPEIFQY